MAGSIFSWALRLLIILYLAALVLVVVDIQGWFGPNTGPIARAFMTRLGFPWNRMFHDVPAQLLPWLRVGAPIVNIFLLNMLSAQIRR
jgi:hypothetical protein